MLRNQVLPSVEFIEELAAAQTYWGDQRLADHALHLVGPETQDAHLSPRTGRTLH